MHCGSLAAAEALSGQYGRAKSRARLQLLVSLSEISAGFLHLCGVCVAHLSACLAPSFEPDSGSVAGGFAGVATTPLDAAKTRIMLTATLHKYRIQALFFASPPAPKWCSCQGRPWTSTRSLVHDACDLSGLSVNQQPGGSTISFRGSQDAASWCKMRAYIVSAKSVPLALEEVVSHRQCKESESAI